MRSGYGVSSQPAKVVLNKVRFMQQTSGDFAQAVYARYIPPPRADNNRPFFVALALQSGYLRPSLASGTGSLFSSVPAYAT